VANNNIIKQLRSSQFTEISKRKHKSSTIKFTILERTCSTMQMHGLGKLPVATLAAVNLAADKIINTTVIMLKNTTKL
jgi:hypothetical protein